MTVEKVVQEIQYVLAPAVMVSSCALLLLGFQNKFSSLANRFRVLNSEKRLLLQKTGRMETEEQRLKNLENQIADLLKRGAYLKNAIVLTYGGIVCFTGVSILIFFTVYDIFQLHHLIISLFLLGLFFVLGSAVLIIFETNLFYRIMVLEKKS